MSLIEGDESQCYIPMNMEILEGRSNKSTNNSRCQSPVPTDNQIHTLSISEVKVSKGSTEDIMTDLFLPFQEVACSIL